MAGIGFELRKAIRDKRFVRRSSGAFSAAFTCFGGMLIGIVLLALIQAAGKSNNVSRAVSDLFMSYVTTTMFLSMLVTSVFSMLLSRYVSDALFEEQYEKVMPSAIGGTLCSSIGGGIAFLAFIARSFLPIGEAVLLVLLYETLAFCWILMNYVGLLRNYKQITVAFLFALLVAGCLTLVIGMTRTMSIYNMILILIVAYITVDALLFRSLFMAFPQTSGSVLGFFSYVSKYPALIIISLSTEIGLLGHFWITWYTSAEGVVLRGLFASSPSYDFPAIVAYFCTIPAMIYFIALFEPDFYCRYHDYINCLGNGGNSNSVIEAREKMVSSIRSGLRNYSSLQVISCLLFITVISKLLGVLNIGMTERMLQTYQMFCVGYSLYSIGNVLMLIQMYFVNEKRAVIPATVFAVVTLISTYIGSMLYGHASGIGLCVSSILYLIIAAIQLVNCLDKLEYHILCENSACETSKKSRWCKHGSPLGKQSQKYLLGTALVLSLIMILVPGFSMIQNTRKAAYVFRFAPEKTDAALLSPGMGYAPWANSDEAEEMETTLVYVELRWADWEPTEAFYNVDYVNEEYRLDLYRGQGRQVVFRFICDNPTESDHIDIPDWLYTATGGDGYHYSTGYGCGYSPNYRNETFIAAHAKAIQALGEAFGEDDFFCYVELGSLGHWGEYHVNISEGLPPLPNYDIRNEYIKPYLTAFPNARFMTRYPLVETVKYGFGLYNDMTGDPEETDYWLSQMVGGIWEQTGLPEQGNTIDAWKTQPIGGEFASSQSDSYYLHDNLSVTLEMLRASHQTFIGPKIIVNETSVGYRSASQAILTTIGYRFFVSEAIVDASGEDMILVSIALENEGIAPIYNDYAFQITLWDDEENVVWVSELGDIQIEQLLPNESQTGTIKINREDLDDDTFYTLTASIVNAKGEPFIPMAMQNKIAANEYIIGQFRIW